MCSQQSYRMDLRDLLVMSVDPEGCQDIDDALSFAILGNGKLQYGVRILAQLLRLCLLNPLLVGGAEPRTGEHVVEGVSVCI